MHDHTYDHIASKQNMYSSHQDYMLSVRFTYGLPFAVYISLVSCLLMKFIHWPKSHQASSELLNNHFQNSLNSKCLINSQLLDKSFCTNHILLLFSALSYSPYHPNIPIIWQRKITSFQNNIIKRKQKLMKEFKVEMANLKMIVITHIFKASCLSLSKLVFYYLSSSGLLPVWCKSFSHAFELL